jgi:hypothetical protein
MGKRDEECANLGDITEALFHHRGDPCFLPMQGRTHDIGDLVGEF